MQLCQIISKSTNKMLLWSHQNSWFIIQQQNETALEQAGRGKQIQRVSFVKFSVSYSLTREGPFPSLLLSAVRSLYQTMAPKNIHPTITSSRNHYKHPAWISRKKYQTDIYKGTYLTEILLSSGDYLHFLYSCMRIFSKIAKHSYFAILYENNHLHIDNYECNNSLN